MSKDLLRPIIGIKKLTSSEVFNIMCDRIERSRPVAKAVITDEMVERASEAAIAARIIPDSCQLMDYVGDISAQDAVDLGVTLTTMTESGNPSFHPLSYIREDEWHDVYMAIARPMVRAALTAAFLPTHKPLQEEG